MDHNLEDRIKDLTMLIQKLADSGYGKDGRREILRAGIKIYSKLVLQELAEGMSLYRSLSEMAPQRRLKHLSTRTWFRPA